MIYTKQQKEKINEIGFFLKLAKNAEIKETAIFYLEKVSELTSELRDSLRNTGGTIVRYL